MGKRVGTKRSCQVKGGDESSLNLPGPDPLWIALCPEPSSSGFSNLAHVNKAGTCNVGNDHVRWFEGIETIAASIRQTQEGKPACAVGFPIRNTFNVQHVCRHKTQFIFGAMWCVW